MAINFSRNASQIIGQYYNFVRFGFEGYKKIQKRTHDVAVYLATEIQKMGMFEMVNDGSQIPIICYKLKNLTAQDWSLYDLADRLRMQGWQFPAYPFLKNLDTIEVQRIVCRADFGMSRAHEFIDDMKRDIEALNNSTLVGQKTTELKKYGFTH